MKWNQIFEEPSIISEEEAKAFMDSHKTDLYTLLDVRQPEEYEQQHLPGATLVPLDRLISGEGELDSEKPVIVYCRSGGRSRAASQWLTENGFKEVYDISSNIMSWLGIQLQGEYHYDLNLIKTDVDFKNAYSLAYAMEEGLQQFYVALEKAETDKSRKAVYRQLAGFEDLHKENLKQGFEAAEGATFDAQDALNTQGNVIEGGESHRMSPFEVTKHMKSTQDIYSLSLAIEAQSYDLYVRLAGKAENEKSKQLFLEMADEEKTHLKYISKELTKHLQSVA